MRGRSEEAAAAVHDKLAGLGHVLTGDGVPILNDALAWYVCTAEQFVETGDHTLVVGRALDGDRLRSGEALTEKELGWGVRRLASSLW